MTRYAETVQTFWCDAPLTGRECTNSYEVSGSAEDVWRQARRDGWRADGGKHYCPMHDGLHTFEIKRAITQSQIKGAQQ